MIHRLNFNRRSIRDSFDYELLIFFFFEFLLIIKTIILRFYTQMNVRWNKCKASRIWFFSQLDYFLVLCFILCGTLFSFSFHCCKIVPKLFFHGIAVIPIQPYWILIRASNSSSTTAYTCSNASMTLSQQAPILLLSNYISLNRGRIEK